jgi:uncharacterized delta-60 repeat protein
MDAPRRYLSVLMSFAVLLLSGSRDQAWAQDGLLDLGFGRPGVFTPFGNRDSQVVTVNVLSDGRILAAGQAPFGDEDETQFALARYKADGSLDASFGVDGRVVTTFGDEYATAIAIAVQADGKIVVSGFTIANFQIGGTHIALARYTSEGALDASFGDGGKVATALDGADGSGFDLEIDTEGRLLVVAVATGRALGADSSQLAFLRYASNGSIDPSFGEQGMIRTFAFDSFYGVPGRIQADGRIVAAAFDGKTHRFRAARFTPDGARDATFNEGRDVEVELPATIDRVVRAAIQADGKVVVLGEGNTGESRDIILSRFNPNGTRDERFGRDGTAVTSYLFANGPGLESPKTMAIQPDGKILVAATFTPQGLSAAQTFAALIRYTAEGQQDHSFGGNGIIMASYTDPTYIPYFAQPSALAIQDDGKILMGGRAIAPGGERSVYDFSVLRFENPSLRGR